MTRREMREQAFVLLFEKMFNAESTLQELAEFADESGLFAVDSFAMEIAVRTMENIANIDERLSALSQKWALNRLSRVTLTVLRLAASEMLYFDDIPVSVSINEAVELAKKYATTEDASFINGVLGSLSRELADSAE
ncbi:MAG: transcription antitermination factor NusB [Ruminococcaceae bacterium]|nr:transcription antitermination factor NusB [Oscillospiraceae bacterium]